MKKLLFILITLLTIGLASCVDTTIQKWNVTFEVNGGSDVESQTVLNESTVVVPDDPSRDGYLFDGWYTDTDLTNEYTFSELVIEDITLYARWDAKEVDITFVLNYQPTDSQGHVTGIAGKYGSEVTPPLDPVREGYRFVGWYADAALTTEYTFTTYPIKSITIWAKWEKLDYVISVISNIDDVIPESVIEEASDGSLMLTVTAEEIEGYTFSHWLLKGTSITFDEAEFTYKVTSDTVLEAVYEEDTVVITQPTIFYATEFEDDAKGSYATGTVTLSGEMWTFNDALIGDLATDLSVTGNSVRIRDGYIETNFAVSNMSYVEFHVGTYGSDSDATVTFSISPDGTNWTDIQSFEAQKSFVLIQFDMNSYFTGLSLDKDAAYYIRISSSDAGRTNIDNFKIYTGGGTIVDDTPLYTITFTDDMVYTYLVNEIVDLDECVATHPTTGATTCDISGTVDNTTPGTYEITYSKTDEFGNTATEVVRITVIDESNADYLTMDLMTYYDDAEGLFGTELMDALHLIINEGFSGVTYGDARYILDETDEDPTNPGNVILVYLGTSVNGAWDSGVTWNREHIWPQSLLGVKADNGKVNSASDLYNLMPANPSQNSTRGNDPYSEMGLGFEPRDEVKGDIARALFYMMIMYDELDLVNTAPGIHEMAYLDELLQWHFEDPVDDFELARLEVIFGAQYNRNPFVDYPHFVNLIWFYNAQE